MIPLKESMNRPSRIVYHREVAAKGMLTVLVQRTSMEDMFPSLKNMDVGHVAVATSGIVGDETRIVFTHVAVTSGKLSKTGIVGT